MILLELIKTKNNMEKIKQLRERTGAGIVDCKKALEESGNDLDKAVEILRKKGIAKAAKRGDRVTSEGIIEFAVNENQNEGYILEVNSETDFVAKNEQFKTFVASILEVIKTKKPANLDALLAEQMGKGTVKESLENLSGVIGEKLKINKFDIFSAKTVAGYSHLGGKIGVLVALDKEGETQLATNIAMHVAASNPRYLNPEDVDPTEIEKEKEINTEILLKEGKPENIIEKILEGKINKYYGDICLIKQEYIKDDKQKVEQILGDIKVEKFLRYSLEGESSSC